MVMHDDGSLALRHVPPTGIERWPAHLAESLAGGCVHLARTFSGVVIKPREASFQHPADGRDVASWFGCTVRYDQPFNALVFDAPTLALPFRHADATQFAALMSAATRTLEAVAPPATIADEARAALRARQGQRTTLASLARALNVSERSLQRKLSEAGVTFRQLLDEVRMEALAEHTPKPQKLTAGALGYSDSSSVRRLRKRWRTKR
jgi:AraC-like DNA-binding protein